MHIIVRSQTTIIQAINLWLHAHELLTLLSLNYIVIKNMHRRHPSDPRPLKWILTNMNVQIQFTGIYLYNTTLYLITDWAGDRPLYAYAIICILMCIILIMTLYPVDYFITTHNYKTCLDISFSGFRFNSKLIMYDLRRKNMHFFFAEIAEASVALYL